MTLPAAMLNFIAHRDHRLMRRVNRWSAPRWIRVWMICATRGGDGWLWYALGAILLLFGGPDRFMARGGFRGGCGYRPLPAHQESHGPQAPVRYRTALLGKAAPAGSVLISFGAHHHRVRRGCHLESVLS